MAIDWTKLQYTLAQEMIITRVLTALLERAGQTGANYFRTLLTVANAYDTTVVEDNRAVNTDTSHYDTVMVPGIRTLIRNYRAILQNPFAWAGVLAREINMSDADKAVFNFIVYDYENVNLGEIYVTDRRGALGALYKKMVDDDQRVVSNYVTNGSLSSVGTTRGDLDSTLVVGTNFLSNCHTGILTFKCVNESVSAPQMLVSNTLAPNDASGALSLGLPDGTTVINAQNLLTVNKAFDDMRMGVTGLILNRPGLASPTKTGDDATNPLMSSASITTPYDGDCFKGQFYIRITRNAVAPIWTIEYFADSGLTQKVGGQTTDTAVGSVVLTKTLNSGSVVVFTLSRANAATVLPSATDDITITLDIETPRLGDTWEMTVTNSYNGLASTLIGKLWPISLPAVPKTPSSAAVAALAGAGAGNVDNGTHSWKVTFVGPGGESPVNGTSNVLNVVDKTVDGRVALSSIPTAAAGTGVTARNIYRTVSGNAGSYKYVGQIADNSTTTFEDNVADANLGAVAPTITQWDDSLFTAISIS